VGTELQHVVAQLALEVVEATATNVGTQLKLRDDLFWFGKPRVLWWLIQFISFQVISYYRRYCCAALNKVLLEHVAHPNFYSCFQNAFEMATFLWFLVRII
jgi:hypothetical protein